VSLDADLRTAIQEILRSELRALHEELQALRAEIVLLRGATGPLRQVLLAGLQRLDARLDAIERGVRRPTPCTRAPTRCRPGRRR
jgi:predicted  nucleic acid-binding Zn-ribbon protein